MREILFRGKRLDNGEWAYGYFCEFANNRTGEQETYIQTVKKDGRIDLLHKVDPATVGQFTGLTANGTRVFEGDILKFSPFSCYPVFWDLDYCAFGSCYYGDFDYLAKYDSRKIEVIGNVHDNPELIGERKDNDRS